MSRDLVDIHIQKMHIEPGDSICVSLGPTWKDISAAEFKRFSTEIKKVLNEKFPGVPVLVAGSGIEVALIKDDTKATS